VLFGAAYEIISCYFEDKNKNDEEDEENGSNLTKSDIGMFRRRNISNPKPEEPLTNKNYAMIALLVFAGILLQPFYLLLKLIELLMECYRKFGCWFYFYSSY
jgi:hypothetical protein